ncbi:MULTISPECIES: transglycosylase family protein [unclassified Streptomyces]|uniref:transglycosylase family protein n=1 Tax=unclassified Streptomyces TaxID=2593676 RepID=UPI0007ECAA7E|nr:MULTISPECIES: transglycosylase family protein [unclassified Streptomyces]MCP3768912.1 transglycosylase family protein [Streptomyces sp. MAR25Y5]OBQ48574.1 peptigoglycan-binding protein LysM [Streptomyces sp. H-KF8]
MLSGNGRHRRPRQAPALLVAAGVTGSAIAIPLLGAGAASAADGSTWDKVAECESGGSWSQNSGNGYYGGLQLTQADWEKYGGLDYATSADQASRGQQIAVAEKILADQGVGAWRACGLLGGLDQGSSALDLGTGTEGESTDRSGSERTATPAPSKSSGSSADAKDGKDGKGGKGGKDGKGAADGEEKEEGAGGSAASDASPSASASPSTSAKGDDSDKSGQKGKASASADDENAGSGRHRGASAEEEVREDRDAGSSGRHASRGGLGFKRGLDGASPSSGSGASAGSGPSVASDSLALGGGWLAQYSGGDEALGAAAPNLILPGQTLAFGFGSDNG